MSLIEPLSAAVVGQAAALQGLGAAPRDPQLHGAGVPAGARRRRYRRLTRPGGLLLL
jgi:hypothetical protein